MHIDIIINLLVKDYHFNLQKWKKNKNIAYKEEQNSFFFITTE